MGNWGGGGCLLHEWNSYRSPIQSQNYTEFYLLGRNARMLAFSFMMVSCLAYCSTLKTEATCVSETSVAFRWTWWHYVTYVMQDRTLNKHHCENLKSFTAVRFCFSSCTGVFQPDNVITNSTTLNCEGTDVRVNNG
jgi:hypothetical protein